MAGSVILNRDAALSRLDGDTALYEEVIAVFLVDAPVQLEILRSALAGGDLVLATRQAHPLKSAAAGIGAERLCAACLTAEKRYSGKIAGDMNELAGQIEAELSALLQVLR